MTVETEDQLRSSAYYALNQIKSERHGISAAGEGDPHHALFERDSMLTAEKVVMAYPAMIPYAIKAQQVLVEHIGQKYDKRSGEEPGDLPHEYRDRFSDQDRLAVLEQDLNLPVILNADGTREMVIYAECDGRSKFRKAVKKIASAISLHTGSEESLAYQRWAFPYMQAMYACDMRHVDPADGQLMAEPKVGFVNTNWKDSKDAYITEEGEIPKPPYKYLNVNCEFFESLVAFASVAENLGYGDFAEHLRHQYALGISRLHQKFWSDKDQFYAPLIDGDGRQVMFIGDDVLEGLEAKIFPELNAGIVINRLLEPDMLTEWGPRTRSSDSRQFRENGREAYHRGPVWLHRNYMLIKGALNYDYRDVAHDVNERAARLELEDGFVELTPVSRDGKKLVYEEDGKPKACRIIAFAVAGRVELSGNLQNLANRSLVAA